jgi:hypothetical protein
MIVICLKILSKDVLGRTKYTHTAFQTVRTETQLAKLSLH